MQLPRAYAFAGLVAAFAVTMIGATLPTPMYPFYEERFGFGVTTTTVVFAVYAAGVLAALLLLGRLSDTLGRRPVLLGALAVGAVSDVVFLVAGDTWTLLVGRLLSGIAAGVFVGTATAAVVETAPERWRSWAPLAATAANIGGLGLGPVLAGLTIDALPWPVHLSFAIHLAVSALAAAAVWAAPETVDVRPGARPRLQRPTVPAAARTTFVGAGIAGFVGFAVCGLFTGLGARFVAAAVTDPSAALEGVVVFSLFAASVAGQVALRDLGTDRAVVVGCGLLAVGMVGAAGAIAVGSLPALVASAVVAGAGQGVSFSKGLAAVLARVGAAERAGTTSAFFVVAYVAISLPVVGVGLGVPVWGLAPVGVTFSLAAAVLAVAALAVLVHDQRRQRVGPRV